MKIILTIVVIIGIIDILYVSWMKVKNDIKERKYRNKLEDVNENLFPHEIELCVYRGMIPTPSRRELLITYSLLHEYEHERYKLFLEKFWVR